MYILHALEVGTLFSNMATSRETRSAIFKLLGQIDHNIKEVEAKNAEIDGKVKETHQETSPFSQHEQESDISDSEVLNGFLQGYNETNHEEGKLFN